VIASIPIAPLRWGILGTGTIAGVFARDLPLSEGAKLVAIGSRNSSTANAFAATHKVPQAHGAYADLVNDDQVDAIYVATPAHLHAEHVALALNADKHVLCEKPFTLNGAQARELVSVARSKNLFLMEAMWTRFLPAMHQLRTLLAEGAIGEVLQVHADLGLAVALGPKARIYSREFGGGSWMDLGTYGVSLAHMILGKPESVQGAGHLVETGVDGHAAALLKYASGAVALLSSSIQSAGSQEAAIVGTKGRIHLPAPWWCPVELHVYPLDDRPSLSGRIGRRVAGSVSSALAGGGMARTTAGWGGSMSRWMARRAARPQRLHRPFSGIGLHLEASEVARCVAARDLESPLMPLNESIAIMDTLDQVRAQMGLKFPGE